MPMGAAQIVFLVITSGVATYIKSTRIAMMMFSTSLSMMGMILIWKLDADNKGGRLTGLTFGGVFAVNIPLSLSLVSSNVAGFTKRSVISALIFVAYCVGNIVGPQFYLAEEEPDYPVCPPPESFFPIPKTNKGIDRNQSSHVRSDPGHILFILPDGVLHLGKPPPGRTIRTPFVDDGERRIAARPVQQDRRGDGKFPLCNLITIESWKAL